MSPVLKTIFVWKPLPLLAAEKVTVVLSELMRENFSEKFPQATKASGQAKINKNQAKKDTSPAPSLKLNRYKFSLSQLVRCRSAQAGLLEAL